MPRSLVTVEFPSVLFSRFPQSWKLAKLAEICSQVTDGTHDSPRPVSDGFPLVMGRHVKNGLIDFATCDLISEQDHLIVMARSNPQPDDILFTNVGTLGEVAIVPEGRTFSIKNVALFKPIRERILSRYLYYYLTSPLSTDLLRRLTAGSVQGFLSLNVLRQLPVLVPPLEEQRAIASVLGALDAKIDLNRRMNETLAAIARTLFKSWFVDFDPVRAKAGGEEPYGIDSAIAALFPDALDESELGDVPRGWSVVGINAMASIYSGGTPSTSNPDYWNGGVPWLSSGETRQPFIVTTERSITTDGVENSSTRKARPGSTVIASAGQGFTRGQTSFLAIESYVNQSVVVVVADESISSDMFMFFDLERRYEQFRRISDSSSIRGSLTTKAIGSLLTVLPPRSLVGAFDEAASPLVARIVSNLAESATLAELRDTLLPKLLSGEVRVSDAERVLEAAT